MSRYRGPKVRIIRRLGNLPGLTQTTVSNLTKRKNPPGQHGQAKKKPSEYGLRLEEKQKLKFNYGITEKQLYQYIKEARRREGITGLILLQLLEMRLDSICFALGFAPSLPAARQLVNHGHIIVNDRVVDIPSFQCRIGDKIAIKAKTSSKKLVESNLKSNSSNKLPNHFSFDEGNNIATITSYCSREDVLLELNDLLVIEYYSRR